MAQLPTQSQFGDYGEWPGRDVLDSGGERLGGVREIYLDRETGRPEWVLVDVDGDEARFVPLADAAVESSTIRVAHARDGDPRRAGHRRRAADRPVRGAPALRPLRPRLLRGRSAAASRPTSPSPTPSPDARARRPTAAPTSSWSEVASDRRRAAAGRAAHRRDETRDAPPIPEPPATTERAVGRRPEPGRRHARPTAPADDAHDTDPGDDAPASTYALSTSPGDEARVISPGDEAARRPVGRDARRPSRSCRRRRGDAAGPSAPSRGGCPAVRERLEPSRRRPPPPPEPSGGPLAVLSSRPGSIAAAVAVAVVLLLIIRRLR